MSKKNMEITQKQLNTLIDTLNHRVTKVEVHVKWIKWIAGATFLATIATKIL